MTNFVCLLDVFHIFFPHKSNFPPKNAFLEKTLHVNTNVCLYVGGLQLDEY